MIFPQDVYKATEESGKMVGENKAQLILLLFTFGSIGTFLVLNHIFSVYLGIGLLPTILVFLVLVVVVGSILFRRFIFREDEKKAEYGNQNNDSFARYMYLQKDSDKEIDWKNEKFHVFEYIDGSITCILEFRFGANDSSKSKFTKDVLQQIIHQIGMYGFSSRITITSEDFGMSPDFKRYIDSINRIEDVSLRKSVMSIADEALRMTEEYSHVDCIYLNILSRGEYKLAELEKMLKDIFTIIKKTPTGFRSIRCLDIMQTIEFYREFYGIVAIDLAMLRTVNLAESVTEDFSKVVKVVTLYGESGKTYSNLKEIDKSFKLNERKL